MKRLPVVYATDRSGHEYWRSLGEREKSPEFQAALEREFPEGAAQAPDGMSRRQAMSLMGAALALAGLTSCRRPEQLILPYARPPEEVIPGKPMHYATAVTMHGTSFGLLVESHEGRPTKVEGHPWHPETLGATSAFLQGMVLDLYDPDRSRSPQEKGTERTWADAASALKALGQELRKDEGASLLIVTDLGRSPTVAALLDEVKKTLPKARVVRYEPFDRTASREGASLVFGRPLEAVYDLSRASTIVSLDADLFGNEGSPLKAARGWATGRSSHANRLYCFESGFSTTGASADHRFRCESSQIVAVAAALARELVSSGAVDMGAAVGSALAQVSTPVQKEPWTKRIRAVAKDLIAHRGRSAIVAGWRQPKEVHALAHAINQALGNVGTAVKFVRPFQDGPEGAEALVDATKGGASTIIVLGGNPVFDAPADAEFAKVLSAAKTSVHLASHVDETSQKVTWHLNRAHPLESWTDAVTEDGTASIGQPLIAPLWGGKTDAEVLSLLLGRDRSDHDCVRDHWSSRLGATNFEKSWRKALHDGAIADTAFAPEQVTAEHDRLAAALRNLKAPGAGYEVVFAPDTHAYDGRFANSGWLQEMPDPMTKLTWGSAALVSKSAADELGLVDGSLVNVGVGSGSLRLPALIAPGQADRTIVVSLGQGRTAAGRVGNGVGVDGYPLRTSKTFGMATGASVAKADGSGVLARTQEHFVMEGRPLAREGSLAEYKQDPEFAKKMAEHPPLESLWTPFSYEGHKWGMSIDLNKCIGCNACMVACQAENNVPVVGVAQVLRSREMHWIRVDRYFEGSVEEPTSIAQPITCQQCANAPCESVCPVGATAHSPEGLNDMAYNRCVGTRYCANNCPYKVRRFNYFEYSQGLPESRKLQFNPDVTVRSRGVMEKCTFCVQRINHAKIDAKKEGQARVRDGVIVTACEQACPTRAITFGDLNDPASRVGRLSGDPRAYHMLEELNIRPRTSYLAKIRNPNPELES